METKGSIATWLDDQGFAFDPFAHLESSSDPNLFRYIIVPAQLTPVWQDTSALVFAPVGAGKTTLRLYAAWNSLRGLFTSFPISYVLPKHWQTMPPPDFSAHGMALARAIANAVLLLLATFPHAFLTLPKTKQQEIASLLWRMSDELSIVVELWSADNWQDLLYSLTDAALVSSFACPRERDIAAIRKTLLHHSSSDTSADPFDLCKRIFDLLTTQFHYQSIHILLDGVDSFPATRKSPDQGGVWLNHWIRGFVQFFGKDIRLKVFAPPAMNPLLHEDDNEALSEFQVTTLTWRERALIEMLRHRINIASNGHYGSLDSLSGEEISGLDQRLVAFLNEQTLLLPRELLAVVRRILTEHVSADRTAPDLHEQSIRRALDWYIETAPQL